MSGAVLELDHLSHSSIRQLQTCSMAWRLRRIDNVRPSHRGGALIVGSVYHEVIAKCLLALKSGEEVSTGFIDEAFESNWKIQTESDGPPIRWAARSDESGQRALCRLMCDTWMEQGLLLFTDAEILGVEIPFLVPIINSSNEVLGTPLKGFIDVIVRGAKGDVVVIDHKTASQSYGPMQVEMDMQATSYVLAARHLGFGNVDFAFHIMSKRKKPALSVVSANRSSDDIDRLYWVAEQVERQIDVGLFLPTAPGWMCESCEYKAACKAAHRESRSPVAERHISARRGSDNRSHHC